MDPPPSKPAGAFPKLERLDPSQPHAFIRPAKRINEGHDVPTFLVSKAYRDIGIFVLQLNRSLCPRKKAGTVQSFTLGAPRDDPPSIEKLRHLLARVESIVEEAPPDPGPRRFGNVSFRTWHRLLDERTDALLADFVAPQVLGFASSAGKSPAAEQAATSEDAGEPTDPPSARDELRAYFLGGFGSAQRLDYGTGHELSFLAFLGCLWKLGAFADGPQDDGIDRSIVLGVIEPYLKVIRRLILTYTLEPAGSHGVWGLDDHSFLPYVFGSAQLTRPISDDEAMPQEGSLLRAPKTGDILKAGTVEVQRELNMYFSAIGFINDVKSGPFWEHSPILFDVSGIKNGWGKINKGMIKMFNAEVLSKLPVVQHFPFGSLFSWDRDPDAAAPAQTVHMANQPVADAAASASMAPPRPGPGTAAPWAQATSLPGPGGPGIPYSRVPVPPVGPSSRPPPTGRPAPSARGRGPPGTAGAQVALTKAPWAKEG